MWIIGSRNPQQVVSSYYIDLASGQEDNHWDGRETGRTLARREDQGLVRVLCRRLDIADGLHRKHWQKESAPKAGI
jgi:hypothetical protein